MGYIFKSFLTVSAFIVSCTAFCQKAAPTVTYYSQEDEADVVMSEGESQTCDPKQTDIIIYANGEYMMPILAMNHLY